MALGILHLKHKSKNISKELQIFDNYAFYPWNELNDVRVNTGLVWNRATYSEASKSNENRDIIKNILKINLLNVLVRSATVSVASVHRSAILYLMTCRTKLSV